MTTTTVAADLAQQVRTVFPEGVVRRRVLIAWGVSGRTIDSQVRARRWQQFGQAVVLHSGPVPLPQRRGVAMANAGSRVRLTSFTALSEHGLTRWERDAVHLVVPVGARVTKVRWLPVVVHQSEDWSAVEATGDGRLHGVAASAALAAESFADGRHGAGLFAAVVQQRLQTAGVLRSVVEARPRQRHRRLLLAALDDIAMGAHALSEIDFAVLCRSLKLPDPVRQALRTDAAGRRRYLDVEWTLDDGRRVVVEVDGALHLRVESWWDDQFRQNEITLDRASTVLRFPSVAVRTRDARMIDQLRRALR